VENLFLKVYSDLPKRLTPPRTSVPAITIPHFKNARRSMRQSSFLIYRDLDVRCKRAQKLRDRSCKGLHQDAVAVKAGLTLDW
jgi:hypothetical protein